MRNLIYRFLIILMIPLLFSCNDDQLTENQSANSSSRLENGDYGLGLLIEAGGVRTRNVDFTPKNSMLINKVWVGIFDMADGKCVSKNSKALNYKSAKTDTYHENFIYINMPDPPAEYRSGRNFVLVCIANFADVTDVNGTDLEERLGEVTTWDDFNSISIDFQTAYATPHNGNTPLLAGFLNGDKYNPEEQSKSHVKIDQFNTANDGGVHLSPISLENNLAFTYKNGGFDFSGKAVYLRRMVANINVTVDVVNPSLTLNQLTYMKYNVPRSAYIIERRTTNCTTKEVNGKIVVDQPGEFPTDPTLSPNYGDLIANGRGYISDSEWQLDPVRNSTTGQWSFSFQHFANKHWARRVVNNDSDREKRNGDGSFSALCDDASDFNNNASYFVLRLQLVDKTTGKAAEALYTIHEGNTSDELGMEESDPTLALRDFVCARNVNYTYHVYVAGFNNIFYNVEKEGQSDYQHADGQSGRAWNFIYANDNENAANGKGKCYYDYDANLFYNAVGPQGGTYERALILNGTNPDIAFRLLGYTTESGHVEGYNYNFPDQSFDWLKTLWPESAGDYSHYFQDFHALVDNENAIPGSLLKGLEIYDSDTKEKFNIRTFIQAVTKDPKDPDAEDKIFDNKAYDIKINATDIGTVGESRLSDYVRVIYIADRNGNSDSDCCTTLINLYTVAQYPDFYTDFAVKPVYRSVQYQRWKDYYNSQNDGSTEYKIYYANSYQNVGGDAWRGNINSVVNIGFDIENDLGAAQYKVSIKNGNTLLSEQTFVKQSCITNEDNDYVVFPVTTAWPGVTPGNYDVEVMLVDPDEGAESGNKPILFEDKLQLADTKWNFSSSPWKDIRYTTFSNSAPNNDRAGGDKLYLPEYNFFVEQNGLEMGIFAVKSNTFGGNTDGYTYIASFLDFDIVDKGPTDSKPFVLTFKTVKTGTLNIYATMTNATAKVVTVDVGGSVRDFSLPAITAYNTPVSYRITNVNQTDGTTIKVYAKDRNNAARYYRLEFIPD